MKGVLKVKTKEITTDMVRHAWQNSPDIKEAYPAPSFLNPNNPNDTIYDWAFHFGQFDHPQYFDEAWTGDEIVYQINETEIFYLYGPGGGRIQNPQDVDNSIKIDPIEATRLGIDFELPEMVEIIKKKSLIERFILWLKSLLSLFS